MSFPATAQTLTPVKVLLDWAWLPYHAPFLIAQEKGYYKEAGLDVTLEQGRGSATTALMLSQGGFDIAHLNITNAAQMIGKGGAIKMVGIYQHKTAAAFIGIKGKVKLDGPQSLKGIKIGSTPGGSDGLSLTGLHGGQQHEAHRPQHRGARRQRQDRRPVRRHDRRGERRQPRPSTPTCARPTRSRRPCSSADAGVPLIGFGFAANNAYLAKNPEVVAQVPRRHQARLRRGGTRLQGGLRADAGQGASRRHGRALRRLQQGRARAVDAADRSELGPAVRARNGPSCWRR